jgi:hypothetical protein
VKIAKRFFLCFFLMAGLFLAPKQSKANILTDILSALFGGDQNKKKDTPPSNSVPLDGGTALLIFVGLGLGAWMLLRTKPATGENAAA